MDTTSPEPIMELSDVVVRYGGVVAVDEVSFALTRGKIYGLIGPNGSGKSTLLAAISGSRFADNGSITFNGAQTRKWPSWKLSRAGVARTFQGARVVPDLTVRENVMLGFDWSPARRSAGFRRGRSLSNEAVDEALDTCGLLDRHKVIATELSYGTQRLVEIARAIVARPQLLLLDEPTAGMNDVERGEIESVQSALIEQNVTQILVEHNMSMIVRMCSHIFVLNSGKLIAEGSADDVTNDEAVKLAYLGKAREGATVAAGN
jgi:ABC-type branched-subunit amino acid transport system ATPase component